MREDILPTRTVYHGTDTRFERFDVSNSLGAHFGSRNAARDRLRSTDRLQVEYQIYSSRGKWMVREQTWSNKPAFEHGPFEDEDAAEGFVACAPSERAPLEFEIDVYRPLQLSDLGMWDFETVHKELVNNHYETVGAHLHAAWCAWERSSEAGWRALKAAIRSAGYDSIAYVNETEDVGSISWIVMDAEKIHPKFKPREVSVEPEDRDDLDSDVERYDDLSEADFEGSMHERARA